MAEMKKIVITTEDIQNAESYIPVTLKEAAVRMMATLCIEEAKGEKEAQGLTLPTIYRENRLHRQQFAMGILAGFYLKKPYRMAKLQYIDGKGETHAEDINYMMDTEELDIWAGSHVMNQLERIKKKRDGCADKVYDLLYDLKGFENMLTGAIRDELERRNDPLRRMMELFGQAVSADALAALQKNLDGAKAAVKEAMDAVKEHGG